MSSAGSQPSAGQRRSLLPLGRSTNRPARSAPRYWAAAAPERQAPPAVWIPTGVARFVALAGGTILFTAAVVAAGSPAVIGRLAGAPEGRFARSASALATCLDPTTAAGLTTWLTQQLLLVAAATSLVVRGMLRFRQPPAGRGFTALAVVLGAASITTTVPLGKLVAAVGTDLTGLRFGPDGCGWWYLVAGTVLPAALVPALAALSNRAVPAGWFATGLIGWVIAAWATLSGVANAPFVAAAATCGGAAAIAVGLLVTARGVIREIRGVHPVPAGAAKPKAETKRPAEAPRQVPDAEVVVAAATAETVAEPTLYTDGSDVDPDDARLSKSERKRLRKLARIREAEEAAAAA